MKCRLVGFKICISSYDVNTDLKNISDSYYNLLLKNMYVGLGKKMMDDLKINSTQNNEVKFLDTIYLYIYTAYM